MTLIVWVGNKDALAFAADSIGSVWYKTFIVNKLFEVSDNDPIWVAIAWSPDFMGVLLETIIKEFRKSIVNRREKSLFDYVNLFLEYIKSADYLDRISNEKLIEMIIVRFIQELAGAIELHVKTAFNDPKNLNASNETIQQLSNRLTKSSEGLVTDALNRVLKKLQNEDPKIFWVEDTNKNIHIILDISKKHEDLLNSIFCPLGSENFTTFRKIVILSLQKDSFLKTLMSYSKLIFFGFGEQDFSPKVCTINLFQNLRETIFYSEEERREVRWWFVEPYAQGEDVSTSILGIGDRTVERLEKILDKKLQNLEKNNIITAGRDKVFQAIAESVQIVRQEAQEPLIEAVSLLSKAELWKIAENFVGIGSMKKRINMGYETIWGPIDVAVVTKADGFVRIKRKFYFDPDINYNYFNRLPKKHDEKIWKTHHQSNEQKHQDSSSSKVNK